METLSSVGTRTAVVYSNAEDGAEAGKALGDQVKAKLAGESPDALLLFISPRYDAKVLVDAVREACAPKVLVGCSSAGEFTSEMQGDGNACAVGISSSELKFSAGIGLGITRDRAAVARAITSSFHGIEGLTHSYSSALILTDALAGHADELLEELTLATGGNYQFFGGGAGDDEHFRRTQVICGAEVSTDAAVGLEILSSKPIGVGVRHGWRPATPPMRVTESDGAVLKSLNAVRAIDVFEAYARESGQAFDPADGLPFFLHNILGIETEGGFKLRVPLAVNADGSISCAAEIPAGASVCIMATDVESSAGAAAEATKDALNQLNGNQPGVAIFFDCVATRLRLGQDFAYELGALKKVLGDAPVVGCNTYGQVARTEGQFSGFHNCTAVVCILPG